MASVGCKSWLLSRNIFVKRRKADKPDFSSCLQLPGNINTDRKYHKFFWVFFSIFKYDCMPALLLACQKICDFKENFPVLLAYNTVGMSLDLG